MTMSLISDELGAGINEEKQRDPEAHSVKKGNQWHFGYKEHIGVDADSGLVHTVETAAANVHDSNMIVELLQGTEEEAYGDSGYLGAKRRMMQFLSTMKDILSGIKSTSVRRS